MEIERPVRQGDGREPGDKQASAQKEALACCPWTGGMSTAQGFRSWSHIWIGHFWKFLSLSDEQLSNVPHVVFHLNYAFTKKKLSPQHRLVKPLWFWFLNPRENVPASLFQIKKLNPGGFFRPHCWWGEAFNPGGVHCFAWSSSLFSKAGLPHSESLFYATFSSCLISATQ